MTKKTFNILTVIFTYLKDDDFGICSDVRVRDLFPFVDSNLMLEGVWLFYKSSQNEVFYYSGVPCDKAYMLSCDPDIYAYLYRLE